MERGRKGEGEVENEQQQPHSVHRPTFPALRLKDTKKGRREVSKVARRARERERNVREPLQVVRVLRVSRASDDSAVNLGTPKDIKTHRSQFL